MANSKREKRHIKRCAKETEVMDCAGTAGGSQRETKLEMQPFPFWFSGMPSTAVKISSWDTVLRIEEGNLICIRCQSSASFQNLTCWVLRHGKRKVSFGFTAVSSSNEAWAAFPPCSQCLTLLRLTKWETLITVTSSARRLEIVGKIKVCLDNLLPPPTLQPTQSPPC